MKKAYSYTRISSRDIRNRKYSIANQKEQIEKYCTANGYTLTETFDDFLPPHREMLDCILARCRQSDAPNVVVIANRNRLARSKRKQDEIRSYLSQRNIKLIDLSELGENSK